MNAPRKLACLNPRIAHLTRVVVLVAIASLIPTVALSQTRAGEIDHDSPTQIVPTAAPEHGLPHLSVFAGMGYLGSVGGSGAALGAGLRLGVATHLALGLDVGWGLLAAPVVQDRWWIMPSVALVIPTSAATFDFGAGFGVATASGYSNNTEFFRGPLEPDWAFQLVPAARLHAMVTVPIAAHTDIFARIDAGTLLLDIPAVGIRNGNPHPSLTDTTWGTFWMGIHYRL